MDPLFITALGIGAAAVASIANSMRKSASTSRDSALAGTGRGYLLVDIYHAEYTVRPPDWSKLVAATSIGRGQSAVIGAILKADDGRGDSNNRKFFKKEWKRLRDAGGDRYGTSWFRGAYHYARVDYSGREQAMRYLETIDQAGGWDDVGCILPVLDLERGNRVGKGGNFDNPGKDFVKCATEWSQTVKEVTGKKCLLYGRGAMRDLKITSRMGFSYLWNPSYTARMRDPAAQGWPRDRTVLWQYMGGETGNPTAFPSEIPGWKRCDMNVWIGRNKGEMYDLEAFRRVLVEGEEP